MGQAAADFSVSYTSADRAWTEWIAWQLKAEDYSVVVQAWDFWTGGSARGENEPFDVTRGGG